jgi:hypothetical protein
MLTIKNVRKDIGTAIGAYTLCDGGLCNDGSPSILENPYYSFYWNYDGVSRRFKFLLDRESIEGKPSIYRIRLYDSNKKVQGTNKDGFVFEGKVGKHLLNDRVDFYQLMIGTIKQYI